MIRLRGVIAFVKTEHLGDLVPGSALHCIALHCILMMNTLLSLRMLLVLMLASLASENQA